ncbi:MAG: hypothetical protein GXY70_05435 [Euryarchaeota archaeon]|nr:hypothetical protein [Euryarchaeota archaeon]
MAAAPALVSGDASWNVTDISDPDRALVDSDVIRINSDAELAANAARGSGSVSDPYVIEDLRIDATGHYSGIFIGNTTAHLVISGCNISGAVSGSEFMNELVRGNAIMLYMSSNVTVEDCSVHSCPTGIDMLSSNNVTVRNNTAYSLTMNGIAATGSMFGPSDSGSHDVLIENNVAWTVSSGVSSQTHSHNVTIRGNSVTDATFYGITVSQSANVVVENNNCSGNDRYGISIGSGSSYCRAANNTCLDNGEECFLFNEVSNVMVENNTAIGGHYYGVELSSSDNCTLRDNHIEGGGAWYGICLNYAYHNRIAGNYLTGQLNLGIELGYSNAYNILENNTIVNVGRPFYLTGSSDSEIKHNIIRNNTCYGGETGVFFWTCNATYNVITNNLFKDFTNPIILMYGDMGPGSSMYNEISFNTFHGDPFHGAVIIGSGSTSYNWIFGNAIIGCGPSSDATTNYWNSSEIGNYWSNFASTDADYDGILDDPCTIGTSSSVDHLPLRSPLWITDPATDRTTVDQDRIVLHGHLINHWDADAFICYGNFTEEPLNCTPELEWSCEIELKGGENSINVHMSATDMRNYADNITVFSTVPSLEMEPENGSTVLTNASSFEVSVEVFGYWPLVQATVAQSVNDQFGSSWTNDTMAGQTDFEATWDMELYEGRNDFTITFEDDHGQTATGVLTVIRDSTAPSIEFESPNDGAYLNSDDVMVEWNVIDPDPVTLKYSLDLAAPIAVTGSSVTLYDLAEGGHTFTLNATDTLGNSDELTLSFTVDVTKPYLEITSPDDGALFGVNHVSVDFVAYDALTDLDHLQYRLDAGSWNGDIGFNITLSDLSDGLHIVYMRTADLAGNVNETSIQFTVDTTAPVVTITSPSEGGYYNSGRVTWTVDELVGLELTEVSTDGVNWTTVNGNEHTFVLDDGTHTVHVHVRDLTGREGSDTVTFTIDGTAPALTITSPASGSYNNTGSVLVKWTASDANGISKTEISNDGASWSVVAGQNATVNGLTDGAWTISVRVTDVAGNINTSSVSVTVSVTGPSVELTPDTTVYTDHDSVTVTADVSDAVPMTSAVLYVHVDGEMVTEVDLTDSVSGRTSASLLYHVGLAEGLNVISLTVNDSAGNSVTVEVQVVLDTIAPTLEIDFPTEGDLLNYTVGIAMWTASDNVNGSGLNNTWARVDDDAWMEIGAAEGWIFSVTGDGEHTLFVRIDDQAGNVAERNVTFFVDTTAPTAEVSPTGDDLELDSVVVVEFSERMNATSVSVIVDGVTGNVAWEGNVLTFTPTALEHATEYLVTVSGKDLAGNAVEMNWTFTTAAGTGSLTGTLVDEDGEPLANVTVRVGDHSAVTNELGRFVLNDMAPGSYVLTVDEEGYDMYSDTVSVIAGESDELGELTLVAELAEDDGSGDNTLLIVIAVVAIIAVVGVAAVVLLKRKP